MLGTFPEVVLPGSNFPGVFYEVATPPNRAISLAATSQVYPFRKARLPSLFLQQRSAP